MKQVIRRNDHMAGKVCMVTGATAGIGKITAMSLAGMGAEVIVTGRNQQKLEDTVQFIKTETGNDSVQYLLADYSDLEQVRGLAMTFEERFSHLDVLVNNAGAFFNSRIDTMHGVEMTFLINHLAPFLLTNLLLGTMQNSKRARIINVASEVHKQGTMNFRDIGFKNGYFGMKAYARSKLANILFTYELVRRLKDSNVTVNTLHPGHVATDIWKTNFSIIGPFLKWVIGLFALTPEEGADNSIYLASSADVAGVSGRYFVKRESVKSSPISYDKEIAQRLWDFSENLTI